jgi:hypothetical protein
MPESSGTPDAESHPIRASFLRHLARDRLSKPLRVSGHPDLADAMREELLRFSNDVLRRAAETLRDENTTRRHVVTVEDMNAALLQVS